MKLDWCGMVRFGLVWHGLVRFGSYSHSLGEVELDKVGYDLVRLGEVWNIAM